MERDEHTTPEEDQPRPRTWRELWQAPALVVALLMLGGGMLLSVATSPKPDYGRLLDSAESLLYREQYDRSLEVLNRHIHPYVGKDGFTQDHLRRFHLLRARAIYYGQRSLGIDRRENHENVVGQFREAERQDATLTPRDLYILGDTYISLDMHAEALRRADMIPPAERSLRLSLLRRMIVKDLARPGGAPPGGPGTAQLLAEFLGEGSLSPDDRAWAAARQAELLLRQGYADDAVRRLLRVMPRSMDAGEHARGELFLLLGRAYLETGAVQDAGVQVERAMQLLDPMDPLHGHAGVLRARVDALNADLPAARERYAHVLSRFSDPEVVVPATWGVARAEAAQGNDAEALAAFREVVDRFAAAGEGARFGDAAAEAVAQSLLDQYGDRVAAGRVRVALEYAELAERIYGGLEESPAPVLLAMAEANRILAEETLAEVRPDRPDELSLADVDPTTREQARRHFLAAGAYFRTHADRMIILDNDRYALSLWLAADSFDRAGDQEEAIRAFAEFAEGFTQDSRQAEARYRLAMAHMARGDYSTAASFFRGLIDDKHDRAAQGVGPFADRSYVPLAQCYLLDGDDQTDERAEELLRRVLGGELGDPNTPEYRAALRELGLLLYRQGRYAESIQRLSEAVDRMEDGPAHALTRYRLADAYRLEARAIARTLEDAMPGRERETLEDARRDRLRQAMEHFERARLAFSGRDLRRLSAVETVALRNAYFYLGDCAFDLGDYETAIHHYDTARARYPRDPASLVAMIQIVHAYIARGEHRAAMAANERARHFYESLPPEVWDDPDLPMDEQAWKRWLDSSAKLAELAAGGSDGSPARREAAVPEDGQ